MAQAWSFGRKVGTGFAVIALLSLVIGAVAVYSLSDVVDAKDRVIDVNTEIQLDTERLGTLVAEKTIAVRGYLLDRQERRLSDIANYRTRLIDTMSSIHGRLTSDQDRRLLDEVRRAEDAHQTVVDQVIALRKSDASLDVVLQAFEQDLRPRREQLRREFEAFAAPLRAATDRAAAAATEAAKTTMIMLVAIVALVLVVSVIIAVALTRTLGRQIGVAVSQVQSSSSELQVAANQQATSTKEQATAMAEITTTIAELLATSRQIAESAQQVARIADQTAQAARTGDATVTRGQEAITAIRRQVDLIVGHMLELGKKSQQIGSVLEIVSELAEQTNILAINATIEAAGAGEAGKRFAVVADEIRKLADRVAASAKEIRGLIDDVRGAVNTTVMTTETGSKAVDAGARHFLDITSAFQQIAALVQTTTEAAKEIELSTRQQATAVEQVNVAIGNVAQTTRETETSSSQTLQTAVQLGSLSRALLDIVQPERGSVARA